MMLIDIFPEGDCWRSGIARAVQVGRARSRHVEERSTSFRLMGVATSSSPVPIAQFRTQGCEWSASDPLIERRGSDRHGLAIKIRRQQNCQALRIAWPRHFEPPDRAPWPILLRQKVLTISLGYPAVALNTAAVKFPRGI